MNNIDKQTINKAIQISIPMIMGYFVLGFSYGVLMQQADLSIIWTFLMSSLVFAGALQYAAIPLLTSFFQPMVALTLALSINIRHVFYGLSIYDKYKDNKKSLPLLLFTMADEAFSINMSSSIHPPLSKRTFYLITSLFGYVSWNVFSLLGHFFASSIQLSIKGLEFALPALFFVMFLNMANQKKHYFALLSGVIITVLSLVFVRSIWFVVVAMMFIVIVLLIHIKGATHD